MKRIILFSVILNLIFYGCGPSQQELEAKKKAEQDSIETARKFMMDSVAQATKVQIEQQRTSEEAAALQAQKMKQHIDSLNESLIILRSQLDAAQTKLQDSRQFQFLRTSDEKEAAIQKGRENVERLRLQISKVEAELRGESFSSEERSATEKAIQDSIEAARQASGH